MDIGCRIKELRKKRGLNQPELGKIVNLTGSTISAIEMGKNNPTPETIIKLCEFFEVSADYLLTGKEEPTGISEEEREILEILRKDDALTQALKEAAKLKKKAISYLVNYKQPEQNAAMG
jgi:transcriptional regulator with XRE-family HTH domain